MFAKWWLGCCGFRESTASSSLPTMNAACDKQIPDLLRIWSSARVSCVGTVKLCDGGQGSAELPVREPTRAAGRMVMTNSRWPLCALLLLVSGRAAQAGLIGATVDVSAYFPNTTSLYTDGGNRVVSDAVEYLMGSFAPYNGLWVVDITDSQMLIEWTGFRSGTFEPAIFNGFFLTGPPILTAVNDVSSVFAPVSINIVGGNVLQLNYQGLGVPAFSTSIIDITIDASAVPEPATWISMFGGCVAGILVARRVRRRDAAPGLIRVRQHQLLQSQ